MAARRKKSPRWPAADNLRRHCERSEAIQSSVPHDKPSDMLRGGATCNRVDCGTEDWIASLRSQ
jgi:hypothetical protein